MSAPEVWGPRLWRLLHTLADLSDRRDIFPLWNSFLRATTTNIPCHKCQIHMAEYWQHHRFLPKGWDRMSACQVREDIRRKLNAFHNSVNVRIGSPIVPLKELGTILDIDRSSLNEQIRADYEFLKSTWSARDMEWKQAANLLIQLVQSGSY